ncbi:hypothetical protein Tco_1001366 [Tanacetum coccineum]
MINTAPSGRKAYLLEDKQIPSVDVHTWMAFGGNTPTLSQLDKITDKTRLNTIYSEELFLGKNTKEVETASQASSDAVVIFQDDGDMMFIEIIKKNDDSHKEEPEVGENARVRELEVEYFDVFPTRSELAYHRIKGMHVFVGNFNLCTLMIVEDISSIIDPRLSQVVLGKPFVEISNMTHDLHEGVVRFTNRTVEIAYKMPHNIKQYNSLSDLKREHTKSVYLETRRAKEEG